MIQARGIPAPSRRESDDNVVRNARPDCGWPDLDNAGTRAGRLMRATPRACVLERIFQVPAELFLRCQQAMKFVVTTRGEYRATDPAESRVRVSKVVEALSQLQDNINGRCRSNWYPG